VTPSGWNPVKASVNDAAAKTVTDPPAVSLAPDPHAPPAPPTPPGGWGGHPPPSVPPAPGGRLSISVHDGKVQIEGLETALRAHLEAAREAIRSNPDIPPAIRDKVLARLDRARAIVERRLGRLSTTDLDKLGDEMEKMGDELEKAMEGLDEDLEQLGDKLGKDLARKLSKDIAKGLKPGIQINPGRDRDRDEDRDRDADRAERDGGDDNDDEDDRDGDRDRADVMAPDADHDRGVRSAVRDLPDVGLQPAQRAQIAKLRTSYEQQISVARKQLDDASKRLEVALADPRAKDADIAKYIDQVSAYEAEIRKARLLTWVNARRLLDDAQRKKIEEASASRKSRR